MAETFYIRLRGRILGPFDEEKLRSLARRGQLSRLHQLSPDGVNWVPASSQPDLFAVDQQHAPAAAQPAAPAADGPLPEFSTPATASAQPARDAPGRPAADWHYEIDGQEKGPVSRSVLMDLIAAGKVKPMNQVWTEDMSSWTLASQVPDFSHLFDAQQGAAGGAHDSTKVHADKLSEGLCRVAVESRPWIMTTAIIVISYSVLFAVSAFIMMIVGANQSQPTVVVGGINNLVTGVLTGIAGYMLLLYANRLTALRYNKAPIVLEKALQVLRTFWVYVTILMVVTTALTVLFIIWLVAIAGTLPGRFY